MEKNLIFSKFSLITFFLCIPCLCLETFAQRIFDTENIKENDPQLYKTVCTIVKKKQKTKVQDACFMRSIDGKTYIRATYRVSGGTGQIEYSESCFLLNEDASHIVFSFMGWKPGKSTGEFYLPEVKYSSDPKSHRPAPEAFFFWILSDGKGNFWQFKDLDYTTPPLCIPPYVFNEGTGEVLYQDGSRLTPTNSFEVIPVGCRISEKDKCLTADFLKYKVKTSQGKVLCGALDITTSETLPPYYGDIKKEGSKWYYRMHCYDPWMMVDANNPTIIENDITYHPAELLMDKKKFKEAIEVLLKDTITDIVDRCLLYADLSVKYSEEVRNEMKTFVVKAMNSKETAPAFIDEDRDKFEDIISMHKYIVPFMDRVDKVTNHQYEYAYEMLPILRKDSVEIDSLYNEFNSIVKARNFIQERKERRKERLRMWTDVGLTVLGASLDAVSTYHSNTNRSSSVSSSRSSGSSYSLSSSSPSSANEDGIGTSERRHLEESIRKWEHEIDEQKDIISTQSRLKANGDSHASSIIKDCERRIIEYTLKIEEAKAKLER